MASIYSAPSTDTDKSGSNLVDGGSGDKTTCTSIYVIGLSPETIFGLYAKGAVAGLQMSDKAEQTIRKTDGKQYQAMVTHFEWNLGLCVRDWRYGVRIANIDTATLTNNAATGANILSLIENGIERLPGFAGIRPVVVCNRTIRSFLRQQISNKANNNLTWETVGGKRVMMFGECEVLRNDAIVNTEADITGTFCPA